MAALQAAWRWQRAGWNNHHPVQAVAHGEHTPIAQPGHTPDCLLPAAPARLIIRLEGLEEVGGCVRPRALVHVHLATALADNAHDAGVRDGRLDGQRFLRGKEVRG